MHFIALKALIITIFFDSKLWIFTPDPGMAVFRNTRGYIGGHPWNIVGPVLRDKKPQAKKEDDKNEGSSLKTGTLPKIMQGAVQTRGKRIGVKATPDHPGKEKKRETDSMTHDAHDAVGMYSSRGNVTEIERGNRVNGAKDEEYAPERQPPRHGLPGGHKNNEKQKVSEKAPECYGDTEENRPGTLGNGVTVNSLGNRAEAVEFYIRKITVMGISQVEGIQKTEKHQ